MIRIAFVLTVLSASIAAQWRGEQRVPGEAGGWWFRVVATGNHHYVLSGRQLAGQWDTIFYASSDGGRTWSVARPVLPRIGFRDMAASGKFVIIAAEDYGQRGGHASPPNPATPDKFYVDVSQDGGQTFQRRFLNTPNMVDLNYRPAVTFDGDAAWVFWGEDGRFYLQYTPDGGVNWLATPQRITEWMNPETFRAYRGRLVSLDTMPVGNDSHLILKRSPDQGLSWTSIRIDAPTSHGIGNVRLEQVGDTLVAAWLQAPRNASWSDIMVAVSTDGGATWSTPTRVNVSTSPRGGQAAGLDLAISASRILVTYTETPTFGRNDRNTFASVSRDGGRTFSATRVNAQPTPNGYSTRLPLCGLAGERCVVAWVDAWRQRPVETVVASISRDDGRSWSTEQVVLTGDVYASAVPPVALGHDGEGAILLAATTTQSLLLNAMHHPWLTRVGAYRAGQSVSYRIDGAEQSDEGAVAIVAFSATGPGTRSGGFPLPGARRLLVDPDMFTFAALTLGPLVVTGPIRGGRASTVPWPVPTGITLGDLWAAAVVIRSGAIGSLTDTIKAN